MRRILDKSTLSCSLNGGHELGYAHFTDTSLRDGLFHEYKKHGKVTGVVIEGKEASRSAIVSFRRYLSVH